MHEHKFEFLRRGGRVKRFHGFHLLMDNPVGHHSFNVITVLIACAPYVSRELLLSAVYHDVPECITGDIPAPFKRAVDGLRGHMEAEEERLLKVYDIQLPHLSSDEARWLKMADSLDGAMHCLEERRLGNRTLDRIFWTFMEYVSSIINSPAHDEDKDNSFVQLKLYIQKEWKAAGGPDAWDLKKLPHD